MCLCIYICIYNHIIMYLSPLCLFISGFFWCVFQDDAQFRKARGAELEYESLKVSRGLGPFLAHTHTPACCDVTLTAALRSARLSASGAGVGEQEAEARPGRDEAEPAGRCGRKRRRAGLARLQGAPGPAQRFLWGAAGPQGRGADPAVPAGQPEGGHAPQGEDGKMFLLFFKMRKLSQVAPLLWSSERETVPLWSWT